MIKLKSIYGMSVLLTIITFLIAGCSDRDSIRSNIESAKLELSNLDERSFRQQQVNLNKCGLYAWFADYKNDHTKLLALSNNQIELRICSVEELQAKRCKENFDKTRVAPVGGTESEKSEYRHAFLDYCGTEYVDTARAVLNCFEKSTAYMEKYLEPLHKTNKDDFFEQVQYSGKSKVDYAKERYASECGYLSN